MKILILGSSGILGRSIDLFLSKKKILKFYIYPERKIINLMYI